MRNTARGTDGADETTPRPSTDEEVFARYVLPELEVLLRVAMSITKESASAEDLVQETLLRAYRSIERFDGSHPRAWLLTILRNAHINSVRRRRPELLRDPDAVMGNIPDRAWHSGSAESIVMQETFDATVESAFNELPLRFRNVIALVDIEGLSYQEAARALRIPMGTVMSRLHRGRRKIRDRLVSSGLTPRSTK